MKPRTTLLGVSALLLAAIFGGWKLSEGPKTTTPTPTAGVRPVTVKRPVSPAETALTPTQKELAALGLDPDLVRGFGVGVGKKAEVTSTNNKKGTINQ